MSPYSFPYSTAVLQGGFRQVLGGFKEVLGGFKKDYIVLLLYYYYYYYIIIIIIIREPGRAGEEKKKSKSHRLSLSHRTIVLKEYDFKIPRTF